MNQRRWLLCLIALSVSSTASAHITLEEPATWVEEGFLGDPQKLAPCGGEGGVATGAVTTFAPGQTITVRWRETIPHGGHFRIALSANRADFVDPETTADMNGDSLTAMIQNPPVSPVLLDGLFVHLASDVTAGHEWSQQVTLPNTPCPSCTLQLTQFMTRHAPGFFYYHCANLRIEAPDAGPVGSSSSMVDLSSSASGSSGAASATSSASAVSAVSATSAIVATSAVAATSHDHATSSTSPTSTFSSMSSASAAATSSSSDGGEDPPPDCACDTSGRAAPVLWAAALLVAVLRRRTKV